MEYDIKKRIRLGVGDEIVRGAWNKEGDKGEGCGRDRGAEGVRWVAAMGRPGTWGATEWECLSRVWDSRGPGRREQCGRQRWGEPVRVYIHRRKYRVERKTFEGRIGTGNGWTV